MVEKKGGALRKWMKRRHIAAHITLVKPTKFSAFSPFLLSGKVWYSMYLHLTTEQGPSSSMVTIKTQFNQIL